MLKARGCDQPFQLGPVEFPALRVAGKHNHGVAEPVLGQQSSRRFDDEGLSLSAGHRAACNTMG